MGNVHAASPPPPIPGSGAPGSVPPPPVSPPPQPGSEVPPAPPPGPIVDPKNPGPFEDLHKKCKDLFPMAYEGVKIVLPKGISSRFQLNHTLTMSTFQPSGYRLGATYIGNKQFSPSEAYPQLLGEIDASGNLNANIVHALTENLKTKIVAQYQASKCVAKQISLDYKGETFTTTVTSANPDPLEGSGIFVTQYLQRVTPSLDLGAELLYQTSPQIPGGQMAALSLAGRLFGNKWTFSGNISPGAGGLHLCYYHKIDEQLSVGSELETSLKMQESTGSVGFQLEIPSGTFKAQLDSNWCAQSTLEMKMSSLPFTFALTSIASLPKSQFRFGIGLFVGGN